MECYFINLDSQPERREYLQRNFALHKAPGWFLNRIQAVDREYVNQHAVKGIIRDGEKGCFLSHFRAIKEALEAPGHVMILEDDAMFGPSSCASIAATLPKLPDDGWDLLFTDLSIYYAPLMVAMMQERRDCMRGAGQPLMNMGEIPFNGSTAYVVNQASKARMLELMSIDALDLPYDVFLRDRIRQGKLRSFVTFPFATSLSEYADSSMVQDHHSDKERIILNAFRRFIWVDRDAQAVNAHLDLLGPDFVDEESATFARVIGSWLSTQTVR